MKKAILFGASVLALTNGERIPCFESSQEYFYRLYKIISKNNKI